MHRDGLYPKKGRTKRSALLFIVLLIGLIATTVQAAPVATFTVSPSDTGYAPLYVTFDATGSTTDNTTFAWDFGDGVTGSGITASHSYDTAGTWTAELNVSDAINLTYTKATHIITVDPIAQFTTNTTVGSANLSVQFTDTSTGHPDNWRYYFGDGAANFSYLQNPEHTYYVADKYNVTLTVTKNLRTNTTPNATEITVNPYPTLTADPAVQNANEVVTFTAYAVGFPVNYTLSYGDGSSNTNTTPVDHHPWVINHTYSTAGIYTATLTANGKNGTKASTTTTVTIKPVADFSYTRLTPQGDVIQFTDISVGYPANETKYPRTRAWAFGDGSISDQGPDVLHTFGGPGVYAVTLTVSVNNTTSDPYSENVAVDSANLIGFRSSINGNTFFKADRYGVHVGTPVKLIAFSTRGTPAGAFIRLWKGDDVRSMIFGGLSTTAYDWKLTGTINNANLYTQSGREVTFYGLVSDVYTVNLHVKDSRDEFNLTAPRLIVVKP